MPKKVKKKGKRGAQGPGEVPGAAGARPAGPHGALGNPWIDREQLWSNDSGLINQSLY